MITTLVPRRSGLSRVIVLNRGFQGHRHSQYSKIMIRIQFALLVPVPGGFLLVPGCQRELIPQLDRLHIRPRRAMRLPRFLARLGSMCPRGFRLILGFGPDSPERVYRSMLPFEITDGLLTHLRRVGPFLWPIICNRDFQRGVSQRAYEEEIAFYRE